MLRLQHILTEEPSLSHLQEEEGFAWSGGVHQHPPFGLPSLEIFPPGKPALSVEVTPPAADL